MAVTIELWYSQPAQVHFEFAASMGPQLYRCGNLLRATDWNVAYVALQWGRNFVVAEMGRPGGRSAYGVSRFNEAATLSLRKWDRWQCGQGGTAAASMGPQLYRCGNYPQELHVVLVYLASMGPQLYRCGNSAPPSTHIVTHLASMGPQLYRCGNKEDCFTASLDVLASMGPATLSLRKRVHACLHVVPCVASMGPQLYRCGNVEHNVNFEEYPLLLQWGRNFIVAETRPKNCTVPRQMQASMGPQLYRCGNGQPQHEQRASLVCFNGAATLSLRKRDVRLARKPANRSSFNGAATLSLRKRRRGAWRRCSRPCFNGAATLSLRKLRIVSICSFNCGLLQWGRNFIVAETSGVPFFLRVGPGASMGPQLYHCGNADVKAPARPHVPASMGPQLYRCGNSEPHREIQRVRIASMGPQLYRCGNNILTHFYHPSIYASMGPQLYRCGNAIQALTTQPYTIASMGPQLYRCGNEDRRRTSPKPHPRFNGAATLSLRKPTAWNRDRLSLQCFNGAATLSLRKLPCLFSAPRILVLASMGPQLYRCGNLQPGLPQGMAQYASMGPQLYRCGNPAGSRRQDRQG